MLARHKQPEDWALLQRFQLANTQKEVIRVCICYKTCLRLDGHENMAVLKNFTPPVKTSATVCQTASFKYDLFYGFLSFVEDFRGMTHISQLYTVFINTMLSAHMQEVLLSF